ncbi:phosphatase PAP2 family protein [Bradyrhizobium sp. Pha-3]|uniref:phosphatase PAP2 family protein n=1 Tax=Bradyrhizobium sp. Pha-3 TaxID=208375 RepID=UPI0035D4031C
MAVAMLSQLVGPSRIASSADTDVAQQAPPRSVATTDQLRGLQPRSAMDQSGWPARRQPAKVRSNGTDAAQIAATLQLLRLNWIFIAIILAAFISAVLLTDFRVRISSYLILLGIAGLYGSFGYLNIRSASRNPRIFSILFVLPQIILTVALITSLGYIAASARFPMQDATLLAFDRSLGLDFRACLDLVNSRPWLIMVLVNCYGSIWAQLCALLILLSLAGQSRRAAELVLAVGMSLAATAVISTLVPAIGVYGAIGLAPEDYSNIEPTVYYHTLKQLPLVRDGTTRLLDAFELGPVMTFPSFHAISAGLYAWAFWPFRWLRGIGLIWNALMLAATPIWGGHYFADVIAGLVVAVASIYAVNRIGTYLTRSEYPRQGARHSSFRPPQHEWCAVRRASDFKEIAMMRPAPDGPQESSAG